MTRFQRPPLKEFGADSNMLALRLESKSDGKPSVLRGEPLSYVGVLDGVDLPEQPRITLIDHQSCAAVSPSTAADVARKQTGRQQIRFAFFNGNALRYYFSLPILSRFVPGSVIGAKLRPSMKPRAAVSLVSVNARSGRPERFAVGHKSLRRPPAARADSPQAPP